MTVGERCFVSAPFEIPAKRGCQSSRQSRSTRSHKVEALALRDASLGLCNAMAPCFPALFFVPGWLHRDAAGTLSASRRICRGEEVAHVRCAPSSNNFPPQHTWNILRVTTAWSLRTRFPFFSFACFSDVEF